MAARRAGIQQAAIVAAASSAGTPSKTIPPLGLIPDCNVWNDVARNRKQAIFCVQPLGFITLLGTAKRHFRPAEKSKAEKSRLFGAFHGHLAGFYLLVV